MTLAHEANSHVGVIPLIEGRTLIIEPKVSIKALFAILDAIYDPKLDFFRSEPQSYTDIEGLFEFAVSIFAKHVEYLIAHGILRGYRSKREDIAAIRGRLLIIENLHHHPGQHDRHWCSFSHFTPDLPENRILRWTAFCLQHITYKDRTLMPRLHRINLALSNVKLDSESRELFERIQFHRLNERYQPVLALARLLLDHLTFSGKVGNEPFLAYLIDMDKLFERYLGFLLTRAANQWELQIKEQQEIALDTAHRITIIPDIVLSKKGCNLLVIDAKYKLEADQKDIYQMIAYCHALGVNQAILVHPANEIAPRGKLAIKGPGNIRISYLVPFPLK
jgi:5-methylcytosine-specific restriction enzyme subunit McrC